jgi:hypothetical protein
LCVASRSEEKHSLTSSTEVTTTAGRELRRSEKTRPWRACERGVERLLEKGQVAEERERNGQARLRPPLLLCEEGVEQEDSIVEPGAIHLPWILIETHEGLLCPPVLLAQVQGIVSSGHSLALVWLIGAGKPRICKEG